MGCMHGSCKGRLSIYTRAQRAQVNHGADDLSDCSVLDDELEGNPIFTIVPKHNNVIIKITLRQLVVMTVIEILST